VFTFCLSRHLSLNFIACNWPGVEKNRLNNHVE